MKALYLQSYSQNEATKSLLSSDQYDAFFSDPAGKYEQLQVCLNSLHDGDTLYIERESCLAGTMPEAVSVLRSLAQRGVDVWCDRRHALIESTSSPYRLATPELAQAVIDFRNAFSRKRQDLGIIKAKIAGKSLGRERLKLPDCFATVCDEWLSRQITLIQAAAKCEMSVTTFWKRAKEYESESAVDAVNGTFSPMQAQA